ncbi:MAG: ribosome silencing factor [Gammaproteobacteria bacterium]|nr:ribosome silencing factor [Gammaproteobacteria bacterium]MBQ0841062.1 ribosome silencing factor [Gammaproteobacteria bacterium]
MSSDIYSIVIAALEDIKGQDLVTIDVRELSDITDTMVVVSGASNRQVKALAQNTVEEGKKAGFQPIGVEGMEEGEWVLVDFGDVIVHVMQVKTRAFYELEKLWSLRPSDATKIDVDVDENG